MMERERERRRALYWLVALLLLAGAVQLGQEYPGAFWSCFAGVALAVVWIGWDVLRARAQSDS